MLPANIQYEVEMLYTDLGIVVLTYYLIGLSILLFLGGIVTIVKENQMLPSWTERIVGGIMIFASFLLVGILYSFIPEHLLYLLPLP